MKSFQALANFSKINFEFQGKELIKMHLQLPNSSKRVFLFPRNYSFKNVLQDLEKEINGLKNLDFYQAEQYNENSNLYDFLNTIDDQVVQLNIDLGQYLIKPLALQEEFIEIQNSIEQEDDVFQIMNQIDQFDIKNNHRGALIHFINFLNQEIRNKQNINDKELNEILEKCIMKLSNDQNTSDSLNTLLHKKNILLDSIENIKEKLENLESPKYLLQGRYLKGLLFISTTHISSFYYMIFHVDWLGWDIIEPITYSVACFWTLVGIRFFKKYGKVRDPLDMEQIFLNKYFDKNPQARLYHQNLSFQKNQKQQELELLNLKIQKKELD